MKQSEFSPLSMLAMLSTPSRCSSVLHVLAVAMLLVLSGCAAQTGIPAHGGGKRFAIEQELVAAATRSALKQIDLSPLRGRQVDVYVHSMGDAGAGNLSGGRFALVTQMQRALSQRGNFQAAAGVQETAATWRNSEELNVDDQQYLSGLVVSYLLLHGIRQAPPSEAEVTLHIILDVFGTAYTRVDWFLANNEILTARTGLEVLAVDAETGAVLMPPQTAVAEAEYNEQYVLWSGPIKVRKSVKKAEPLMVDFTDVSPSRPPLPAAIGMGTERELRPHFPFQYEWDKYRAKKAEQKSSRKKVRQIRDKEQPAKRRGRFRPSR